MNGLPQNTEYKTVDEYREAVKTQLEDTAVQTADYELYSDAWNEVQAASEIKDYPKEDVDAAKKSYQELNEKYVKDAGMEMADFLKSQGMSEEDLSVRMPAVRRVQSRTESDRAGNHGCRRTQH